MSTTLTRAKRPTAMGAVLAVFAALFMFASPAQAAKLVDVTATETTIVLGESVTLNWTSTEATQLTASGAWSGAKAIPNGSEVVTPTTVGTKTFTLATDSPGPTDSVTVEVTAAEDDEVTPLPVTFPGECTVVVPETEGVIYSVTIDGETFEIDADEYDGEEFWGEDGPAVFTAEAAEGFTIADGATVRWTYDAEEDCAIEMDNLVTTKTACSSITFTNISDLPLIVLYGIDDEDEDEADGEINLAVGASKTVKTSREDLAWVAFDEDDEVFQYDVVSVPQDCGVDVPDDKANGPKWPNHPTSAPAAGVSGNGGTPVAPALALLGGLALFGVRRGFTLGR